MGNSHANRTGVGTNNRGRLKNRDGRESNKPHLSGQAKTRPQDVAQISASSGRLRDSSSGPGRRRFQHLRGLTEVLKRLLNLGIDSRNRLAGFFHAKQVDVHLVVDHRHDEDLVSGKGSLVDGDALTLQELPELRSLERRDPGGAFAPLVALDAATGRVFFNGTAPTRLAGATG